MTNAKKARRRTVAKINSQEDLINKFESGEGVSKKSQQMLDDLKERDKSKESEVHDEPIFKTASELDRVLVDYIQPQPDNARYLPVKFAHNSDDESIAALNNCVVCEKDVLENRLSKDNPRYDAVNKEIEEIRNLAETLKHSELVHPISVWRKNMTDYPIVAGHRRFYAIRFLYGGLIKIKAKIYAEKPQNLNILRHIENFSRSDLTPPDALDSYAKAVRELENLEGSKMLTERISLVTSYLGISRTSYFRYDKLYEHFDVVHKLLENKVVTSLVALYEEIKKAEEHKDEERYLKMLVDASKFTKYFPIDIPKKPGRVKQYITMPKVKVTQISAIRRLLTEDVTKLDVGIDWEKVNFDDAVTVEKVLKSLLVSLSK